MVLNRTLADNPQVVYVIDRIKKHSRTAALDVVGAYNLLCDGMTLQTEEATRRIRRAYIMCKYMDPDAEDVISMLLLHEIALRRPSLRVLLQYVSEKRAEQYHKQMSEACKNAPEHPNWSAEECISYYVMMRVCDKMLNRLMRTMNRNRLSNTFVISDAYGMAKEAHMWRTRETGEPSLVHPLRVAEFLMQLGVESSVIAAALLHDTTENKDYPVDRISKVCGAKVAQYVGALASVQDAYIRCSVDEKVGKRFEKLLHTVIARRDMIFALYIKAADRIQELRAIESSEEAEIRGLVEETRRDYLPLFQVFKLNYFVREIENLVWRAADVDRCTKMEAAYEDMVSRNSAFLEEFKALLHDYIDLDVNHYALTPEAMDYDVDIHDRRLLPYEVYECLKRAGVEFGDPTKTVRKSVVPICDIDIVVDPLGEGATVDTFVSEFARMFNTRISVTGRTIMDFYVDAAGAFVFEVGDRYRNVFRCRIVKRSDYDVQKTGIFLKSIPEEMEEDSNGKTEKINVQLRNGKVITLPKGAIVIDVAFAIHEEVGYAVSSAIVNGHKASIYKTLSDGDRVIIETDTRRADGVTREFVPHARISWLNWVATKRAKKMIINFLSDRYEGDDPRYENEADTAMVLSSADKILSEWHPT